MAEGKWVEGLRPDLDLEDASRKSLEQRLRVAAHFLPLALRESEKDIEYVHQLRVATRRADACLRIFKDNLSGKCYKAMRGRLRAIRQAASEARDCDVFLCALRSRATEVKSADLAGLDFLIAHALGQREAAQRQLNLVEEGHRKPFAEAANCSLAAIRPSRGEHKTLESLARALLADRTRQLDEASAENLNDYEQLHQVRIAGKRLRYAIEVVAVCFGPALRETIYPCIEEMQDILGRANDSYVANSRLQALKCQLKNWPGTWKRVKSGIESLVRLHQRRLLQERKRFLLWLDDWKTIDLEPILGINTSGATV